MKTTDLPKLKLTLNYSENRYQCSLDKEVIKHLNMPEKYPPFNR